MLRLNILDTSYVFITSSPLGLHSLDAASEQLPSACGVFNMRTSTRRSGCPPASLPRTFNWLSQEVTSYSTGTFHDSTLILKDRSSGRNFMYCDRPKKKEDIWGAIEGNEHLWSTSQVPGT